MATTKTDVRAELLKITNIKPKKNESESDLAVRVAEYINTEMDEEAYKGLSRAATNWYEKAVKAAEKEEDLPAMPTVAAAAEEEAEEAPKGKKAAAKKGKKAEAEEEAEEEGEEEEAEEAEEEAPKGKKGAAAKKTAAAKKGAEAKKGANGAFRSSAGAKAVRQMLAKNPKITIDQCVAKVGDMDVEISEARIKSLYKNSKKFLDILVEAGWSKG